MKTHRIWVGILAGATMSVAVAAQSPEALQAAEKAREQVRQQTVSPSEFRERMIEWAIVSQDAYSPDEDLAVKIAELSEEQMEDWLALIKNPEAFLQSMERVVRKKQDQQAAQQADKASQTMALPGTDEHAPLSPVPPLTTLFSPDYPPGSGAYKTSILDAISGFGIGGASSTNRCDAADWGDYVGVWWPLNKAFDELDGACVVAGCDPTGIACAIACGILETAKIALKVAAVPLEACDVHQGAIDGAEIEATYENTKGLVGDVAHLHTDLGTHDANIDGDLAAHDANIDGDLAAHDANIDGDLAAHDANIDGDLAAHDANIDADLAAHDANIDGDLQQHDADMKELVDGVQETLDEEIELRKVHMQVLQIAQRQRYLVTANEAGVAVSVDVTSVEVFNEETSLFETVPTATVAELEVGVYDVQLNLAPKSPDKVFRIRVRHDDEVDHYGEILFHRTTMDSSN